MPGKNQPFRTTVQGVVEAFLEGRSAGTPTLQTNGQEVWSYGIPIARMNKNAVVEMLLDHWVSPTTCKHQDLVRAVCMFEGFEVRERQKDRSKEQKAGQDGAALPSD